MNPIVRYTLMFVISMSVTNGIGIFTLITIGSNGEICNTITEDSYKQSAMYNPKMSLEQDKELCKRGIIQFYGIIESILVVGDGIGVMLYAKVLHDQYKEKKNRSLKN